MLAGCDKEIAILDRHAQLQLASGFTWAAGVSSPGCIDENPKCVLVITGNFQPNTLDCHGSFKLGKNDEILYNQTMQYLSQTVPRIMAALGVITPQDVQEFIKACRILDRFPMPSDANSSKGVTVSQEVRRTPCPEGMTIPDFVEVRVMLCISVHANVGACADTCVTAQSNCRVQDTRTHTHRLCHHTH